MKKYKVWVEVEEIDEEADTYTDVDIVDIPSCGTFGNLDEAVRFAKDLQDLGQNIVGEYETLEEEPRCRRCDSVLPADGRCSDGTCPFSDRQQNDPQGWAGHPDMDHADWLPEITVCHYTQKGATNVP